MVTTNQIKPEAHPQIFLNKHEVDFLENAPFWRVIASLDGVRL